jgi:hypothetical protein
MSATRPPERETPEERFERISKLPGVVVHYNPNPEPWQSPTDIRVREGVTVRDILGRDDGEDEDW